MPGPAAAAGDALLFALSNNGKILACGNGGSAADAQHFIAELAGRFERERLPPAGIPLNTDTDILTAVGNDYGFQETYQRQANARSEEHTSELQTLMRLTYAVIRYNKNNTRTIILNPYHP